MQICKVKGCNQPITSKETGLCHKHHLRFIRHGTTELTRQLVDKSEKCIVEGCDRGQQTNMGYCLKHYKEWKRSQPIDPNKKCVVCGEPIGHAGCNGMCAKHYSQWRLHGNPLHREERLCQPYGNPSNRYYKTPDGRWLHKVVAEEILGRELEDGEIVHHINLNKLDNSKSNIYVCKSNKEHLALHRQLERVAAELIELGIIKFENGEYKKDF